MTALDALSALAQESRLDVFRLLLRRGRMAAGEIAQVLDVPHNTLSAQLSILSRAGLLRSERRGRSIIYAADLSGIRRLLAFLIEDCCQGSPQVCAPLLQNLWPTQATTPQQLTTET